MVPSSRSDIWMVRIYCYKARQGSTQRQDKMYIHHNANVKELLGYAPPSSDLCHETPSTDFKRNTIPPLPHYFLSFVPSLCLDLTLPHSTSHHIINSPSSSQAALETNVPPSYLHPNPAPKRTPKALVMQSLCIRPRPQPSIWPLYPSILRAEHARLVPRTPDTEIRYS